MTEGQIVAEAIRLARLDPIVDKPYFTENAIRHALRLATQPEQDPARITALEAENERMKAALRNSTTNMNTALAAVDKYNEDNGTHLVFPAFLRVGIQVAANGEILDALGGPHDAD